MSADGRRSAAIFATVELLSAGRISYRAPGAIPYCPRSINPQIKYLSSAVKAVVLCLQMTQFITLNISMHNNKPLKRNFVRLDCRVSTLYVISLICSKNHRRYGALMETEICSSLQCKCIRFCDSEELWGTKVRRYNRHSAGSLGWPFPMLKY